MKELITRKDVLGVIGLYLSEGSVLNAEESRVVGEIILGKASDLQERRVYKILTKRIEKDFALSEEEFGLTPKFK